MNSEEIAKALIQRVLAGDIEGAVDLYADDAVAWRNLDGRELVKKQVRSVLRFLTTLENLRYDDIRIQESAEGFVQQHTLCCTAPGGEATEVHVCLVGRVEGGRLVRMDEYMDSAAMAPLMG